jgi:hypothetical protein
MHELNRLWRQARRLRKIRSSVAVRRSTRKFVTAGGDRGLHQLPKRSRNFSNVRTLNLV